MNEQHIKVLSVCTSDAGGGASRAAYRIHQGVRSLRVESVMFVKNKFTQGDDVVTLNDFIPDGIVYKVFDWLHNKFKNKIQHFRWSHYPKKEQVFMSDLRGTALHGALRKLDYDVVHLHWVNQRFLPLDQLPKGKPIVWTLHDSWPFCGVCHYFLECKSYQNKCGCCQFLHSNKVDDLSYKVWKKKKQIYKGLDLHIVSPSQWLANCAKQSSLLGQFPVTVIPNCLNVDVFRPLEEKEISLRWRKYQEKKLKKPYVLFGAIHAATDKIKGFTYLISALKFLEMHGHGDDFEVIVFGANKSELDADVHIPIHYVGYLGNTQELVSLYNLCSVMVVPSLTEVFGQTASESLACGVPVVAFRCTGIQEVVIHKQDGYLANPYESEDLAEGILWCLKNNSNNCLGQAGRKKVLRTFAETVVCQQYKELYESVLRR